MSISLNRAFVFELWIGHDLVRRLKMLRKGLLNFGIFEKQDSSQVKPQQDPHHFLFLGVVPLVGA